MPSTVTTSPTSSSSSSSASSPPSHPRRIRTPRRCGFPECTKTAKRGGLCISHGGGKKCAVEGCQTSVVSRGFCVAHGGGKRCQHEGCPKSAQTGGFCWLHGGGTKCSHEGCSKRAQSGGACISHGGGRRCRIEGCNKVVQYDGLCVGHGGYRHCRSLECHTKALSNGYCAQHCRRERERSRHGVLYRRLSPLGCPVAPLPPVSSVGNGCNNALVHPMLLSQRPLERLPSASTLLPPLHLPGLRDLQRQSWDVGAWRRPPLQLDTSNRGLHQDNMCPAKLPIGSCLLPQLGRGYSVTRFEINMNPPFAI